MEREHDTLLGGCIDVDELVSILQGDDAGDASDLDDEEDPKSVAYGDFIGAHVSSFEKPEVGLEIADQRIENVARQAEQRADRAYIERAQVAFHEMVKVRDEALKQADEKHKIGTSMLTHVTVDDLIADHNTLLSWPPSNTDPEKGFEDKSIATLFVLDRFGVLKARRAGKAGILDRHNDNRHSAGKDAPTFPHTEMDGNVDWGKCGCSTDHDDAHRVFWEAWFEWRLRNVYGESTISGIDIVKPTFDATLAKLDALPEPERVPHLSIERLYLPHDKYAQLAPRVIGHVTLYCSPTMEPSLAVNFPWSANRATIQSRAAESFHPPLVHYPYVSAPLCAAPSRDLSALPGIQQIEVTYDEVRFLLGIELEDEAHGRHLSRVYLARSYGSADFDIPPIVGRQLYPVALEGDSTSPIVAPLVTAGGALVTETARD